MHWKQQNNKEIWPQSSAYALTSVLNTQVVEWHITYITDIRMQSGMHVPMIRHKTVNAEYLIT